MDVAVIKYVGLAWVVYGAHSYFALAQMALCLFLVANGVILLTNRKQLGKWAQWFGLLPSGRLAQKPLNGWLMLGTGAALILPLFGLPYWLAVAACPVGFYWVKALSGGDGENDRKKSGILIQKGLLVSSVLILAFTIWEGKDLIKTAVVINSKAAYYQMTEVFGWQKKNNPNAPKKGEMAPDFEVTDLTGTKTIRLSDFRGERPVVLLFGSFT